jgi:DNA mismatch repair protein MSH4
MAIDRATLLQLELLVNSKTGKTKHSLIGTIDKTKTVVGGRLLRTNLMMPPTNVDTIQSRLDLVDVFLSNEDFFYSVLEHLSRLPDVDKMLSNIALVPKGVHKNNKGGGRKAEGYTEEQPVNARVAAKGISALVGIKSCLSAMPALSRVLQTQLLENDAMDEERTTRTDRSSLLVALGSSSPSHTAGRKLQHNDLLKAVINTLNLPELGEILNAVTNIFTPSTEFTRNANAMKHQECFALRAEEGGIMSLLRKNYLANVDDIYKKADEYAEQFGYNVIVKYTTLRGYFLAIPAEAADDLPTVFMQPSVSGKYIHCTTEEVNSLNTRSKDNVRDLLIMTHSCIQDVMQFAREHYDAIASLCDAIALLDMCHSFADTISLSTETWCRPIVVDPVTSKISEAGVESRNTGKDDSPGLGAALLIRKGRFGIQVPSSSHGDMDNFVANDVFAAADTHLTLVTGINGSGKTTYLKQIAIIVVLAHCGSYVPAEQASIPLRDRLCTRIGNTDDQENNISTFMMEMKEMAFICNNVTPKSLVLIDELGRATSNEDGVALAWSVAEYILKKKAMTYFVTHFPKLTELADLYHSVQNIHLDASVSTDTREIKYSHCIKPGVCSAPTDYGVSLAGACGWPDEIVAQARQLERVARGHLKDGTTSVVNWEKNSQHVAQDMLHRTTKSLLDCIQVGKASSFNHLRQNLGSLWTDLTEGNDDVSKLVRVALSCNADNVEAVLAHDTSSISECEGLSDGLADDHDDSHSSTSEA